METPAQVTEAHRAITQEIRRTAHDGSFALRAPSCDQLIADSEAMAFAEIVATKDRACQAAKENKAESDQFRAEVERLTEGLNHEREAVDAFCADRNAQRARADLAEFLLKQSPKWDTVAIIESRNEWERRALKAEAELAFQVARNSDLFTQRDEAVAEQEKAEDELASIKHETKYVTYEQQLHAIRHAHSVAEAELAEERSKVRLLRNACKSIVDEWSVNHDANPFHAGSVMMRLADKALDATEDKT